MADALRVICSIRSHPPWSPASLSISLSYLGAAGKSFKLGRLVGLTRKQQRTQWQTRTITQQMQFGAKSTFGTA